MFTVSAAYSAAIALGKVRLCELVDVELANGTTYRYTNHPKDLTWNAGGDTYSGGILPEKYRGAITHNTSGGFDECEIALAGITGDLVDQVKSNILEASKIKIRQIRWDTAYAADEEVVKMYGTPDVGFNTKSLQLRIVSILDSLNIQVPRHTYQPTCNNYLFDETCGLTRADYAYSGTATDGSTTTMIDVAAGTLYTVDFDAGDETNPIERGETVTGGVNAYTAVIVQIVYLTATTGTIWYLELSNAANFNNNEVLSSGGDSVTVNGTAAEDRSFYRAGEIEMLTGDNAGECRPLTGASAGTWTTFWPFPVAVAMNDTYKLYPGDDGQGDTCLLKFNNDNQWRGFPYGPPVEETIM